MVWPKSRNMRNTPLDLEDTRISTTITQLYCPNFNLKDIVDFNRGEHVSYDPTIMKIKLVENVILTFYIYNRE